MFNFSHLTFFSFSSIFHQTLRLGVYVSMTVISYLLFFLIFAISSIFIHPRADLYEGFCCLFLHQKGHFDLIKICRLVSPSVSLMVGLLFSWSVHQLVHRSFHATYVYILILNEWRLLQVRSDLNYLWLTIIDLN